MATLMITGNTHPALVSALRTLDRTEVLVLDLTYEQHLTNKEIAQVLDLPEDEVGEYRVRALARLRDGLTETAGGSSAAA